MSEVRVGLEEPEAVRACLDELTESDEERAYARLMLPRYIMALDLVEGLLERRLRMGVEDPAIVDVAPHLLTELFSRAFSVRIHTIGARFRDLPGERRGGEHLDLDLNSLHEHAGWRGFHRGDVVFMGEILEHLHASPRMVLGCASRWIRDDGYLVVQTPNAVALDRRLTLLLGSNPYDMIREGSDPGHFREYTAREVERMGAYWGLEHESTSFANYFRLPHRRGMKRLLYGFVSGLRPTLRDGMTIVFRRPAGTPDPRATSRDIRGHVEGLAVRDGWLIVQGWAVDLLKPGPVGLVELVHSGHTFHGAVPDLDRPDVVRALGGEEAFLRCGFRMEAPLPADFEPANLIARTRDIFGDWYDLPPPDVP